MLYYWRMKNWEKLQQAALGSHGIVTFAQARAMGIFPAEMYRWCRKGLLMKSGRGVFRMTAYPSQGMVSDMAALLALFGDDAYLCGESVLALYGLCPTRSYVATVAVPGRMRKTNIPHGVAVVRAQRGYKPIYHDGIACQRPQDAIRACMGIMEKSRLCEAVEEAENKGYLMSSESEKLKRESENGKATA